jgi:hypothetical protein
MALPRAVDLLHLFFLGPHYMPQSPTGAAPGTAARAITAVDGMRYAVPAFMLLLSEPVQQLLQTHLLMLETNLQRLEELRPHVQRNPALARQLEESITTLDRLRATERWLDSRSTTSFCCRETATPSRIRRNWRSSRRSSTDLA